MVDDHDEVAMYLPSTNKLVSQQTSEQTKVIEEVVSLRISMLNHAVINKTRRSYAVFCRKKNRKKKMDSSNPSYQSMDCVIKWGNRFIISTSNFFLKMFIAQWRKNRVEMR